MPIWMSGVAAAAHDIMVATGTANPGAALVLLGGDLNDTPGSDPINALEGDGKLIRVAKDVAAQGTYKFGGTDQAIDHIFITKALADAYVPKSATVVRDPGESGFAGSDHATLWADFTRAE
jgi:predicted extracellular nuclease